MDTDAMTGAQTQDEAAPAIQEPRHAHLPDAGSNTTLVIEGDVIPRRLHRPIDVLRAASAVVLGILVLTLAYFASSTTSGIDADISTATQRLPQLLLTLSSAVAVLGMLILPIAAAVDMIVRGRSRQLAEAVATLVLTLITVGALIWVIGEFGSQRLIRTLTGAVAVTPQTPPPLHVALAGLVSFITVSRMIERNRWNVAAIATSVALGLVSLVAGMTAAGLLLSVLIGWCLGLLARYVLGTPTTRPIGLEVAAALDRAGFPLTVLRASRESEGGRQYSATTDKGERLEVTVLDRDLEGAGIASRIWRSLRLRDDSANGAWTMRARLDQAALLSYASLAAGAHTPRLTTVCQVGPDAALLAYEHIEGRTFANLGPDLSDDDLRGAWDALKTLHEAQVSHRALGAESLFRSDDGKVWLSASEDGRVAASDLAMRLDLAELLSNLALVTSPARAVSTGVEIMGHATLAKALPVLQPVALQPDTRRALKKRKDVLVALRDQLVELNPGQVEQIRLERLRPKTLLTIIAGTVAGYIVLTQLTQVNLGELIANANWAWAGMVLVLSASTYIGAALSLSGFVPERLSFVKTAMAQLAASFATLISPPTLGAVAINVRYLQQSNVHPALAAASVGVSQVMAFFSHVLLLLGFSLLAGSQAEHGIGFKIPAWAIMAALGVVALIAGAFTLRKTREWFFHRIRPIFQQVGPRLLTVAQRPAKLAEGIGGILLLNLSYCLCLFAAVKAFGGELSIAAVAVVYLAGSTIGQAAPTPGGLGAVEAALAAGLTAAGLDGGLAVSATLLFRIGTFWLPTIPGWFAFNHLQKSGNL